MNRDLKSLLSDNGLVNVLNVNFAERVVKDSFSVAIVLSMWEDHTRDATVVSADITGSMDGKIGRFKTNKLISNIELTTDAQAAGTLYKLYESMGRELFWYIARHATEYDKLERSVWARFRFAFAGLFKNNK